MRIFAKKTRKADRSKQKTEKILLSLSK